MTGEYKGWVDYLIKTTDQIEVVKPGGETDAVSVIVCRLKTDPLLFPDNLLGHCYKCFRLVQFRPHAPKLPQRICDQCAHRIWKSVARPARSYASSSPRTRRRTSPISPRKGSCRNDTWS